MKESQPRRGTRKRSERKELNHEIHECTRKRKGAPQKGTGGTENWRVELRETGEMSLGPWPLLVFSAFVPLCLCHSAPSVSHGSTQMLSHKKAQDAQEISAHEKHECTRKGEIRYWLLEIEKRSKVKRPEIRDGKKNGTVHEKVRTIAKENSHQKTFICHL